MLKSPVLAALAVAAAAFACSPTTSNQTTPPGGTGTPPADGGGGGATLGNPPPDGGGGAATDPANPGATGTSGTSTTGGPGPGVVAGGANDGRFLGPEISHSKGQAGGIVILWPRIIPGTIAEENAALAAQVQAKVKAVAEKALPGKPIDVRPKPERVCPKAGCDAMSVGVLFTKNSNSCVAIALINAPGTSPIKMIPWGGLVELKSDTIQFRDMPENFVKIKDYVPCDQLLTQMATQDSFIEAAIRAAAGGASGGSAPPASTPPAGGAAPAAAAPSTVTSKPAAKK
jgi:hypothetical protein